jgi:hypothetical protein
MTVRFGELTKLLPKMAILSPPFREAWLGRASMSVGVTSQGGETVEVATEIRK